MPWEPVAGRCVRPLAPAPEPRKEQFAPRCLFFRTGMDPPAAGGTTQVTMPPQGGAAGSGPSQPAASPAQPGAAGAQSGSSPQAGAAPSQPGTAPSQPGVSPPQPGVSPPPPAPAS